MESRDLVLLKAEEEDKPKITKPCLVKAEERRQTENYETLLLNEQILVTKVVTKLQILVTEVVTK